MDGIQLNHGTGLGRVAFVWGNARRIGALRFGPLGPYPMHRLDQQMAELQGGQDIANGGFLEVDPLPQQQMPELGLPRPAMNLAQPQDRGFRSSTPLLLPRGFGATALCFQATNIVFPIRLLPSLDRGNRPLEDLGGMRIGGLQRQMDTAQPEFHLRCQRLHTPRHPGEAIDHPTTHTATGNLTLSTTELARLGHERGSRWYRDVSQHQDTGNPLISHPQTGSHVSQLLHSRG